MAATPLTASTSRESAKGCLVGKIGAPSCNARCSFFRYAGRCLNSVPLCIHLISPSQVSPSGYCLQLPRRAAGGAHGAAGGERAAVLSQPGEGRVAPAATRACSDVAGCHRCAPQYCLVTCKAFPCIPASHVPPYLPSYPRARWRRSGASRTERPCLLGRGGSQGTLTSMRRRRRRAFAVHSLALPHPALAPDPPSPRLTPPPQSIV